MQIPALEPVALKPGVTAEQVVRRPGDNVARVAPLIDRSGRSAGEALGETREAIAARLAQYLKESGRDLEFRVDPVANATVITVRRADTGEIVRQFPNEEALYMLRRLNEQSGTFVDLFA